MINIPDNNNSHISNIQIRFNDLDIVNHVNNAIYQEYFDIAKTELFNFTFGKTIDWKTRGLVLAHIEIDYHQPTYFEENIIIESKITKVGTKSFEVTQVVRQKDTKNENGVKCIGKSIMVAYHYQKAYSFALPSEWIEKINSQNKTH